MWDADTVFLLVFGASILALGGTGCASLLVLVKNDHRNFQESERLQYISAGFILPTVISFACLSWTRLGTWKGRPPIIEGKRFVGSAVRRWEFEEQHPLKDYEPTSSSGSTSTVIIHNQSCQSTSYRGLNGGGIEIVQNDETQTDANNHGSRATRAETTIAPTPCTQGLGKLQCYAYWVLSITSSFLLSFFIWSGLAIFSVAFRLRTKAVNNIEISCENYYNLGLYCYLSGYCIVFAVLALNFMLFVLSRGTAQSQSLVPIFLPFVTAKRDVFIDKDEKKSNWIMKVKQYWMIGEDFVMDSNLLGEPTVRVQKRQSPATTKLQKVWNYLNSHGLGSVALWYLMGTLLYVLDAQFVTMGIIEEQQYFGVIPNGWSCYYKNNSALLTFSCSSALKAMADINVSSTDKFYCYKLRNVTLDSNSDLTGAFGITFSVFVFSVAALHVCFKSLAGICSIRKDLPEEDPTHFFAKLLAVVSLILLAIFCYVRISLPELLVFNDGRLFPAIIGVLLTVVVFAILTGCLEYAVEESEIGD